MSTDIRAFSVFKTFPLVTCFIGLGVGYALADDRLFKITPWALLVLVGVMKLAEKVGLSDMAFPSLTIFYWNTPASSSMELWIKVSVFMVSLIYLLLGPFGLMVCIGSRLGVLFNKFAPLPAYCVNIGGAIIGSVLFTLLAYCELSPGLLLVAPALVILFYVWNGSRAKALSATAAVILAVGIASYTIPIAEGSVTHWSPYQRIDIVPVNFIEVSGKESKTYRVGYQLCSNRAGYLLVTDWSVINNNHLELIDPLKKLVTDHARYYAFPFQIRPPKDVLVVGAGTGNDVAQALKCGATSVDAVEIDPVIIKLGIKTHPLHPYDDPRVHLYCNDARNFFKNCKKHYDLIVFSFLDSHVTTAGSSVRIDNYVYTKESFAQALNLLTPDGLVVISFYSYQHRFDERLFATIAAGAGYHPLQFVDSKNPETLCFLFGPAIEKGSLKLPSDLLKAYDRIADHDPKSGEILSDDWPYLYISPGILDVPYLLVVAEMLILALYAGRKLLQNLDEPTAGQMFFLGAAFLLLELQAISRLSLLFGATWLTSGIVINGVLVMILAANILIIRLSSVLGQRLQAIYALLFLSLVVSFSLPHWPTDSKVLGLVSLPAPLVTIVTLLPIFLAAMIFAISFARSRSSSKALAFNLYGAFFGAMLEYLSNFSGVNSLVLVAIVLYALSFALKPKTGEMRT
jgi:hypothetical protein